MTRKLTDDEIKERVLKRYPNSKNIQITWIKVKNKKNRTRIKVKFLCGVCGSENDSYFDNISRGRGCYTCGLNKISQLGKIYTKDIIEDKLSKLGFLWINPSEYHDANSSLKTQCINCDKIAKANVINRIVKERKCGCFYGLNRKTLDYVKEEIVNISNEEYKLVSNKYINAHTPLEVLHLSCGCVYETTRANFRKGKRCPNCVGSKGELQIKDFLDKNNIIYKQQYKLGNCKFKNTLPFDFAVFKDNKLEFLIEYDGRQHFEIIDYFGGLDGFVDRKIRDTIKDLYCKENNIRLIRIPYWKFDGIDNILKNLI